MRFYIIIPAHNEEAFLADTLNSILAQTHLPTKVLIVNDNSTDGTETIIDRFSGLHQVISKLTIETSNEHLPGSKVVNAFNHGLNTLDSDYDFIVKLDADCILPSNYFEKIAHTFSENYKIGIAGGFAYEQEQDGEWKRNHPMNTDHVRGAFKTYSNNCFKAIGGLKTAMGWDTVDELLARYHGFEILTDPSLHVKHLRPTGTAYNKKAKLLQGKAMYGMRYGFLITFIASFKMATKQGSSHAFFDNMKGYLNAKRNGSPYLVSEAEGEFIRKWRWQNIRKKLF